MNWRNVSTRPSIEQKRLLKNFNSKKGKFEILYIDSHLKRTEKIRMNLDPCSKDLQNNNRNPVNNLIMTMRMTMRMTKIMRALWKVFTSQTIYRPCPSI